MGLFSIFTHVLAGQHRAKPRHGIRHVHCESFFVVVWATSLRSASPLPRNISLSTFHERVDASNSEHRSVQSLHGYDGLLYQLQTSMAHHTKSLILALSAALMLIGVFGTARKHLWELVFIDLCLFLAALLWSAFANPLNTVQHG